MEIKRMTIDFMNIEPNEISCEPSSEKITVSKVGENEGKLILIDQVIDKDTELTINCLIKPKGKDAAFQTVISASYDYTFTIERDIEMKIYSYKELI